MYEKEGVPLPAAGERYRVVDSDGKPVAVIELTRVATEPIGAVGDAYAHAEGRGYRDAADWRSAHEAFFRSEFVTAYLGFVPDLDDTLVVGQRLVMFSACSE
ncbi:MAG TPA: ASCH domain-containing protein [Jiangellaceae bacterium]|nr:ASCH domain-containing protein [Jiangellaceae bacterium]